MKMKKARLKRHFHVKEKYFIFIKKQIQR